MKNDDIEKLFQKISEHFKDATDPTKKMFGLLVNTTLKFRDELNAQQGKILTVAETQKALNAFMEVLKTQKIPPSLDKHELALVIRWLEEIKLNVKKDKLQ